MKSTIRPLDTSRTWSAHGSKPAPEVLGLYCAKAGAPLALTGMRREPRHPIARPDPPARVCPPDRAATSSRAASIAWRLRGSRPSATPCHTAGKHRRIWPAVRRRPDRAARPGRSRSTPVAARVDRALCNALLTDATVPPRSSATSEAFQFRTSRRMSTARWRGGSCWRATMKASRMVSRDDDQLGRIFRGGAEPAPGDRLDPRLGRLGRPRSRRPGHRRTKIHRPGPPLPALSTCRDKRWWRCDRAMNRTAARPSKRSNPRQARTRVSCTASSASKLDPSMR